jgi:hypothetical protein
MSTRITVIINLEYTRIFRTFHSRYHKRVQDSINDNSFHGLLAHTIRVKKKGVWWYQGDPENNWNDSVSAVIDS